MLQQKQDGTQGETDAFSCRALLSNITRITLTTWLCSLCPSPDEHPFTKISELPTPLLPPLEYPKILHPNKVNLNSTIFSFYVHSIVPRITHHATLALAAWKRSRGIEGDDVFDDDGNYGSAATMDVEILQGISKRVHYGEFRGAPGYSRLSY